MAQSAAAIALVATLAGVACASGANQTVPGPAPSITLQRLATHASGTFDQAAAEIAGYDPRSHRLFVTSADANSIRVLDISVPSAPKLIKVVSLSAFGGSVNSVTANDGLVAVAVQARVKTDPGVVAFLDVNGHCLGSVPVGSLPDMLTFTPDGRFVLVANEGEPNEEYTVDPEGSVSIIDLLGAREDPASATVRTVDFRRFNDVPLSPSIRVFGPGATVAQDLEPEHVTVSHDSRTAWVSLQENNALAVIDINSASARELVPLGSKDHSIPRNAIDASDRDGAANIVPWPVFGLYQPDAIASFRRDGHTYLVSANEGDARDYDGYSEEARVRDLTLDPGVFPNAGELRKAQNLGRLRISTASGDTDGDGDHDVLYSFGGRSFSIWDSKGSLVYDSGSDFERITAGRIPAHFNSDNDDNDSFDSRSDNSGPEPEGIAVGQVRDRVYAFIGLERVGGIMVYDISEPRAPRFVQYLNNRDFGGDPRRGTAGDLGPEGLLFIPRDASPIDAPLLVVANEISATTTVYRIDIRAQRPVTR